MKNQQSKDGKKRKVSRGAAAAISAIAIVLLLGSGLGVTHMTVIPRYKEYTNPEPGWCRVCHKKPASHAENWTLNHGMAATPDRSSCAPCHEPGYCKECHKKRPASHEGNWASAHITSARTSEKSCYECHTTSYCAKCHGSCQ